MNQKPEALKEMKSLKKERRMMKKIRPQRKHEKKLKRKRGLQERRRKKKDSENERKKEGSGKKRNGIGRRVKNWELIILSSARRSQKKINLRPSQVKLQIPKQRSLKLTRHKRREKMEERPRSILTEGKKKGLREKKRKLIN